MGLDANIYFRATGNVDELVDDLPDGFIFEKFDEPLYEDLVCREIEKATHFLDFGGRRYFGEGGGNGPGGLMITALMALVRHPNVAKIWYGYDGQRWTACDSDRVLQIAVAWMKKRDDLIQ